MRNYDKERFKIISHNKTCEYFEKANRGAVNADTKDFFDIMKPKEESVADEADIDARNHLKAITGWQENKEFFVQPFYIEYMNRNKSLFKKTDRDLKLPWSVWPSEI